MQATSLPSSGESFWYFLSLPLWRPRSSRFSRWLLFSIDETLLFGRKTLNKVFALITWSINMMFWGRFPRVDMHGQRLQSDLAGQSLTKHNRSFALTEFRGDWSYFKLIFGLTSSWKGGANVPVCFLCKAFGKRAPSDTILSHRWECILLGDDLQQGRIFGCRNAWWRHLFLSAFYWKQNIQALPALQVSTCLLSSSLGWRFTLSWTMVWFCNWGPLIFVRNFHPHLIKWCTLHVLNLGILYTCNGASLWLGSCRPMVA